MAYMFHLEVLSDLREQNCLIFYWLRMRLGNYQDRTVNEMIMMIFCIEASYCILFDIPGVCMHGKERWGKHRLCQDCHLTANAEKCCNGCGKVGRKDDLSYCEECKKENAR